MVAKDGRACGKTCETVSRLHDGGRTTSSRADEPTAITIRTMAASCNRFFGPPSVRALSICCRRFYSRYIEIFARFGLPISITADNGPQFASEEFHTYCESNNIELISTTPYWPQWNGEVERQNRSILKRLKISQCTGKNWMEDLNEFLLMYRSTPHSTTQKTER